MREKTIGVLVLAAALLSADIYAIAEEEASRPTNINGAAGEIYAEYSEVIKLKPDTAEFSVTYISEGATPNAASNRNIENTRAFQAYLKSVKIKESDITTLDYKNYAQDGVEENASVTFLAVLVVSFNMEAENFYDIVKLLEKNGIADLRKNESYNRYYISIYSEDRSEEKARKEALERFEKIDKLLKGNGATNIDIYKYDTEKKSVSKHTKIKKYLVSNTIKIKTENLDGIGNIIAKAQELKMNINNDLEYSVSDKRKDAAIQAREEILFEKLLEKAERIVKKSQYSIGDPKNLRLETRSEFDDGYYGSRRRYREYGDILNGGIAQTQQAMDVAISPPSEFSFTIGASGTFYIVKGKK